MVNLILAIKTKIKHPYLFALNETYDDLSFEVEWLENNENMQ
jgi:hypothetical protein